MEVLEFIKKADHPVTKKEIVDATGFDGDFKSYIRKLKVVNDGLKTVGTTSNTRYFWAPQKELYSEMKNQEGYSDGTAGKAIANVMKSSGKYPMRQQFGEVWSSSVLTDDQEGYLVASAKEGIVICYAVYPTRKGFMKDGFTFKWNDMTGYHYVSMLNVVNVSERRLSRKLYELSMIDREAFRELIGAVMDISSVRETTKIVTVEKEIEKPVEVIKEVPVEVVKEVEVIKPVEIHAEERDIELAVLKTKCEIYEKWLFPNGGAQKLA